MAASEDKAVCPRCGSREFITEPNSYDVLIFNSGKFEVKATEMVSGQVKVFCRECLSQVDEMASSREGRVVLK